MACSTSVGPRSKTDASCVIEASFMFMPWSHPRPVLRLADWVNLP